MVSADLPRLPGDQRVVVVLHLTPEAAKQITYYERVAYLIAEPEMVVKDYFERDDHRDMLDCILSLLDPDRALRNVESVLVHGVTLDLKSNYESGLFFIKRDEHSTPERTLAPLERHFNL